MPRHFRPLVYFFFLLILMLLGLWLAFESQARSTVLSLNQSFLFLGGTALGFLILGVEGIRLVLSPKKDFHSPFSLLSLFLLAYTLPAILLILPGLLVNSVSSSWVRWWANPLPHFTLPIQSIAAGILLMTRFPTLLVAWTSGILPRKEQLYLWLTGLVCGLGAAVSYQFLLIFYQPGISLILTADTGTINITQTGFQPDIWNLDTVSKTLLLIGNVLLAPVISGFLFRNLLYHKKQTSIDLPNGSHSTGLILGIAFIYAALHLNPFTLIPAFLLMTVLFTLDRLTSHPLPGLLTHASVNLLACLIDWRWIL